MASRQNLSETARVTTAQESAFRIDRPNSRPRAVHVVALDDASWTVARKVADLPWARAAFFSAQAIGTPAAMPGQSAVAGLKDLAGRTESLLAQIGTADLVILVAGARADSDLAALIGEACRDRRIDCAGIILGAPTETLDAMTRMRPHVHMLVIAEDIDYLTQMLISLRA